MDILQVYTIVLNTVTQTILLNCNVVYNGLNS